jgi:hypothetical protein
MLFNVIGSVIVGLIVIASVWACCSASLTVPPKDLARRWRAETRGRR